MDGGLETCWGPTRFALPTLPEVELSAQLLRHTQAASKSPSETAVAKSRCTKIHCLSQEKEEIGCSLNAAHGGNFQGFPAPSLM